MKCWEQYSDEETMVGGIWKKRAKENLGKCLGHRKCRCCCCSVAVRLLTSLACDSDNVLKIEVFTFAAKAPYFQLEDTPHPKVSLPHAKVHAILFLMLQLIISMCLFFIPLSFWIFILSWIVAELVGTGQQKSVCVLVRVFSNNLITVLLNPCQNINGQRVAQFSPFGTFWSWMSFCTKLWLEKTLLWWPCYAFVKTSWFHFWKKETVFSPRASDRPGIFCKTFPAGGRCCSAMVSLA